MKPSNLINKLGKDNSVDNNKAVEALRKIGGNKQCFDCSEKGVTYVVPKIGIFVCSRCAGIHREISHMVKGLGVSNFSETEINFIKEMGNDNCQNIWMGKFNPSKHTLPKTNDDNSVKDFLKLKYIDKKFYSTGKEDIKEKDDIKGTKTKSFNQDEELEEDLKPENLRKKEKDVSTKMKNVIIGDNKKDIKTDVVEQKVEKTTSKPLSKLSIGGKSNENTNSNNNWNPNFPNSSKTSSKVNDPFSFDNNNTNDEFEFPSSETNTPNNTNNDPFGWGNNTVKIVNQTNPIEKKTNNNTIDPFEFNFVNNTTNNTSTINQESSKKSEKSDFFIVDDSSIFSNNDLENKNTNTGKTVDSTKTNNKNIDDIVNMLNSSSINEDKNNKQNSTIIPSNINFNISNNLYGHPGMLNNQFQNIGGMNMMNPQDLMFQISQNPQLLNMINSMVNNQNVNSGGFNNFQNHMNQGTNFQNNNNLNNIDFSMNYQNNKVDDIKVNHIVSKSY